MVQNSSKLVTHIVPILFKLGQGASIRANVGLSVRGKFVESKNHNSLIIFDDLINFWHYWGDRGTTKINSKETK